MRFTTLFVGFGLMAALSGCNGASEAACAEDNPCPGFGDLCIEGQCVSGACNTSVQCPMEYHCDNRQCVAGCNFAEDCYPGSICNDGVCEDEPCLETAVDCGFREFCNTATGDCYDAGANYCKPCDVDNQTADCGEGNYCLNGYCGSDCSGGKECPSGFECYPFSDQFGQVITWQCFTYCWLYEDYEPGSFVAETPEYAIYSMDFCPMDEEETSP